MLVWGIALSSASVKVVWLATVPLIVSVAPAAGVLVAAGVAVGAAVGTAVGVAVAIAVGVGDVHPEIATTNAAISTKAKIMDLLFIVIPPLKE
jgi:hypothetical protein